MTHPAHPSDRGAATAEFAVVVPAVVTLLLASIAAVLAVDGHGRLVAAAGAAARAVGRGDEASATSVFTRMAPDATMRVASSGGVVCVTATRTAGLGALPAVLGTTTSCAADGGG